MKPNELEIIILKDIVNYQLRTHGLNLTRQLESLEIKKREFTGFGIYVHFELENQDDLTLNLGEIKPYVASPIEIYLDTLEHQISFELNLNNKGQFDFLEIVPNGVNKWNGQYEKIKTKANN
jgi:hypothetical protein